MSNSIFDILKPCVPNDHSRQATSQEVVATWLLANNADNILDLGCGDGRSLDLFRQLSPSSRWTGLDIEESPEVALRTRTDGVFLTYDGVNIPLDTASIDLVFSHQVLEHVRHPEAVIAEVYRVLKPGGAFIGSTSQLEPYHSFSLWNYTVFGFKTIVEEAGLTLSELRPGIDGRTLIERSYLGRPQSYSKYFAEESPLNAEIEDRSKNRNHQIRNFRKLIFCGHFVFTAIKR